MPDAGAGGGNFAVCYGVLMGVNMKRFLLIIPSILILAACSLSPELSQKKPDTASKMLLTDHPLAGKIWDVNAATFINKQQLAEHIVNSNHLMLGETHDNRIHHQNQAWAINVLNDHQRSAIVAFEMISQQQGEVIADRKYDSSESLIAGLDHIKTNWKYQQFYAGIFDVVIKADYTILPANFDRQKIMLIIREGENELSPEIKTMLDDNALPADQAAASRKEIEGSHCGMINEKMTESMMLMQRAKDAQMALALTGQDDVDTRVLVAGSGHVRKDRGVPFYLSPQDQENNLLVIGWVEVQEDVADVEPYAAQWGTDKLPFDYVWFTPRVDRPDPCEQFRQHMKSKK